MHLNLFLIASFFFICSCTTQNRYETNTILENLSIAVKPTENRAFSFTNKKSAYFYGSTHQNNFDDYHAGWNIAKQRIFNDYTLWYGDIALDRMLADVRVNPAYIERQFSQLTERFFLIDNKDLLYIEIQSDSSEIDFGLHINRTHLRTPVVEKDAIFYSCKETDGFLAVAPKRKVPFILNSHNIIQASPKSEGYILTYAPTKEKALMQIKDFRRDGLSWLYQRSTRMADLISNKSVLKSDNDTLNKAIKWLTLTTDQLITKQQGNGIYAGLPWFNEYWGRDMFISMPGATLITGQFNTAKSILNDFSLLQDTEKTSPTYGRIPNRANLETIFYNTTDGTPRFVIQAYDYLKYSADTAFVRQIYPAVHRSIEASIELFTDQSGYLIHDDADTWMDVKRNGIPWSPRGNRANDIQALWHKQLLAGADMAFFLNDQMAARKWHYLASELEAHFEKDFSASCNHQIADHLNVDGSPDLQFRPNQLYTFELIHDEAKKMQVTRDVWQKLVFPWGVASLDQHDPQFHPYHENWHYYHKDDAYHNGTIWLWNNGEAMQRMIEFDQPDIAFTLFENMNKQALFQGAIGSLSENADAHPREGNQWAKRSGTFLQAWSNAEQLRVWNQYFLGIRPNMIHQHLVIEPKIPSCLNNLAFKQRIGQGALTGSILKEKNSTCYTYHLDGETVSMQLIIAPFPPLTVSLKADEKLHAIASKEALNVYVTQTDGQEKQISSLRPDIKRVAQIAHRDTFFKDTQFATVFLQKELPCLQQFHPIPLTY